MWVARHGMSTYKDTTPHISFRTGPPSSKHKRMGAQAAPFRRFSCVCVGEACLLRPARARGFGSSNVLRHVYPMIFRLLFLNLTILCARFSGPPSTL